MMFGGQLTPGHVPSSHHPNQERHSKLEKAHCGQLAEEREMVWAKHPRSTR